MTIIVQINFEGFEQILHAKIFRFLGNLYQSYRKMGSRKTKLGNNSSNSEKLKFDDFNFVILQNISQSNVHIKHFSKQI